MCKAWFEQWLYNQCVCKVIHYHGAHGIFSAEEFLVRLWEETIDQSISSVGTPKPECLRWTSYSMHHVYRTNFHGSWLPSLDIGQNKIQMISISIPLLWWNIRGGFITKFQILVGHYSLGCDYQGALWLWTSSTIMCEDVRCLSLKPNYRLTRKSLSGINKLVWVNSWIFRWTLQLVANVRHLPTNFISPQISILFSMIYSKQWIGPVLINFRWVYLPWTISIEYWTMNSLQNKNLMKLIMLFTSPLPYICLAWCGLTSTRILTTILICNLFLMMAL